MSHGYCFGMVSVSLATCDADLSGDRHDRDDRAKESVAISSILNGLGPGKQAKSEANFVCFEG